MAVFNSSEVEAYNPVLTTKTPEPITGFPGGTLASPGLVAAATSINAFRFIPRGLQRPNKTPHRTECQKQHADLFWFEHIHVIPNAFALGTVLSTQLREYEVYNAFKETTHQITNIVKSGVDGITLTGEPTASPRIMLPGSGFVVSVNIDPAGPVTIALQVNYVFGAISVTKTVSITGTRVVILATEPQSDIMEEWEWVTDIIEAAAGNEVRISSRDVPREKLTYRFLKEDVNIQQLVNQLWGWADNTWGVPVWNDYTTLTADVAAGVTTIPVADTDMRDFRDTGLALIWTDEDNFEAVEIDSFTSTEITTVLALNAAHSSGALVMPVHLGKLPRSWSATNYNTAARDITVSYQILNNVDFEDVLSPKPIFDGGTYRDLPVWDIYSDYLITGGTYSEQEEKGLNVFGDNLGKFHTDTTRDFPRNRVGGFSMESFGREEFWRMRAFFHNLRGMQKSFWMASGRDDFTVESTTTATSSEINIEINGYTDLIMNAPDGPKTRRNIEIRYVDGTVDRRRIVTSQLTSGVREVLTLDSGITQEVSVANVERISYFVKRRLTTDKIIMQHQFYEGDVIVPSLGVIDVYDGE